MTTSHTVNIVKTLALTAISSKGTFMPVVDDEQLLYGVAVEEAEVQGERVSCSRTQFLCDLACHKSEHPTQVLSF